MPSVKTGTGISPQPFFPVQEYPELDPVRPHWQTIRDEGLSLLNDMMWIEDSRTAGKIWAFAPLYVEEEDRDPALDELSAAFRARVPRTIQCINSIPMLLGCGFSLLLAGGRIGAHEHRNPFVTAMLGLTGGEPCWIRVGAETRQIRPGETVIFDYSFLHEVVNDSPRDRLVLLILLPNKHYASDSTRREA